MRIPVTKSLRDEFAMQLHVSLAALQRWPSEQAWEPLAQIFNVIQIAVRDDPKRSHEALLINSGARALQQIERRACSGRDLPEHEIAPIRIAVDAIDRMMGKLDVMQLNAAMIELQAMAAIDHASGQELNR